MAGTNVDYDLRTLAELGVQGTGGSTPDKLPTPRKLQLSIALTCLATFLFFSAVENATAKLHYAVQTIGHDSAPSIILAEEIKASLADMDADVANELLAKPGENSSDITDDNINRKTVTD